MDKQASIPVFTPAQTEQALIFAELIPALREAFASGAETPLRQHYHIPQQAGPEATLLLMPAWQQPAGYLGVKIVTVFPGNTARGLPGLASTYLLCDGVTGAHLALIDGNQITVRRTVAVAALAASFLSRPDASSLLVVGAGRVASLLAYAFHEVRPLKAVEIWDISPDKAEALALALRTKGFAAQAVSSLEAAARRADIISCATLSTEPLIKAEWLRPGTHLDLIGSFTPHMREVEDDVMRVSKVFIDAPDALVESGDLIGPITAGVLQAEDIAGTLQDLCARRKIGRENDDEITVFKAVGTALSDITAGVLAYKRLTGLTLGQ